MLLHFLSIYRYGHKASLNFQQNKHSPEGTTPGWVVDLFYDIALPDVQIVPAKIVALVNQSHRSVYLMTNTARNVQVVLANIAIDIWTDEPVQRTCFMTMHGWKRKTILFHVNLWIEPVCTEQWRETKGHLVCSTKLLPPSHKCHGRLNLFHNHASSIERTWLKLTRTSLELGLLHGHTSNLLNKKWFAISQTTYNTVFCYSQPSNL